jgi:phosphoribosylglycinamide formyltransferase 1
LSATRSRVPIIILISGRGSNMRALLEHCHGFDVAYSVAAVFSDQADAPGLATAREFGARAQALVKPKGMEREAYDLDLVRAINAHSPALLVLAGFMRILSKPFVEAFQGRMLNIHPSLLPKYPGLHTHRQVLEAGEKEHGATVHFVTEELDAGPAVIQGRVVVRPDDTEATLAARVQRQEHRIYPMAVDWFAEGRLLFRNGQAWLDGRALEAPIQLDDGAPLQTP